MKTKKCDGCGKEGKLWKAKTKTQLGLCKSCAMKNAIQIGNYKILTNGDAPQISSPKQRSPINTKSDKQKKIDAAYRVLNIAYLKKNKVCMAQFEGICQGRATECHHTYYGSNKRKHYLNESTFKALCVACHWHLHNKMDSDELVKLGLRILD